MLGAAAVIATSAVALVSAPTLGFAAGKRGPPKRSTSVWKAPSGRLLVPLRSGDRVSYERYVDSGPARIAASAVVQRAGDDWLRLDVFTNPGGLTARAWLRGAQSFLAANGARVHAVRRARKGETAVSIDVPANPQIGARCITLVAANGLLLRATTEACSGSRAPWHRNVVAGVVLLKGRK